MIPLKDDIPTTKRPIITVGLIAINIGAFLWQLVSEYGLQTNIFRLGLIPYEFTHRTELTPGIAFPVYATVFTSMFMHGGFFHLGGNMLYLWIFGNNVEDQLGHLRFLLFYFLCGIAAVSLFVLSAPNSKVPLVGASGAVAGVLGAYAIKFPKAGIWTLIFLGFFIRVVRIPAMFILGFWFIVQILNAVPAMGTNITGGVAWFAHIGGFVAGMILFGFLKLLD